MLKSTTALAALVAIGLLSLGACGGGGGEDYSIAFTASDISGPSATRIAGGSPPDVTPEQVRSQVVDILVESNVGYRRGISVDWEGYVSRTGNRTSSPILCKPSYACFSNTFEPIMVKNGIRLAMLRPTGYYLTEEGPSNFEELTYRGWMDYSVFGVTIETEEEGYHPVSGDGFVDGYTTHTSPAIGPLTWNGVMVGRNSDLESTSVSNVIQGDAAISAELSQTGDMSVDVTFSNIKDLNTGGSLADIAWADLSVIDGTFEDSTILGSFFGPQHEEVAGVFEKNYVLGAFGARR